MPASVIRNLGYTNWANSCGKYQQWMSRRFEEHLMRIFTGAGEFREREPKLRGSGKNPDFLIRDATNGSPCYVEAKAIYDDRGPHTYFESCLILELGERNSIHGLGISLRHVHGELDHIVSDNELSQITDWLTTVDYGLIFSDDCPCQTFQFGDAKYEATAMHDYDIGKLLISVSYSSHRTIIPDIEDPLDKIVRQTVEWYPPDLLAGIPLVLAILNCSTHKHIDGTTELYGIQYVSIDKASGEVVDSGLDGSGLWRTNRRKMDISQAVPAVWIWQHATDEQPTLYMNPDIEDPVLPSSLFGFAYWRRGDTSMGKIEMECGVGHAAHPGQLSRAHLEYINKHDELRGDKPRHPEVRPFSY